MLAGSRLRVPGVSMTRVKNGWSCVFFLAKDRSFSKGPACPLTRSFCSVGGTFQVDGFSLTASPGVFASFEPSKWNQFLWGWQVQFGPGLPWNLAFLSPLSFFCFFASFGCELAQRVPGAKILSARKSASPLPATL